jgi:hypothetical protein
VHLPQVDSRIEAARPSCSIHERSDQSLAWSYRRLSVTGPNDRQRPWADDRRRPPAHRQTWHRGRTSATGCSTPPRTACSAPESVCRPPECPPSELDQVCSDGEGDDAADQARLLPLSHGGASPERDTRYRDFEKFHTQRAVDSRCVCR